jgi:hypothetical protein
MTKFLTAALTATLASLTLALSANAATIGFDPSSLTPDVGDPISVDIVVSDLGGEIVSAYDLDILFDPSVLSANFVAFSDALGSPGESFLDANLSASGVLDVAGVSLLSDAELLSRQGGDSVVLATLGFTYLGGSTTLSFSFDAFNDVKGAEAAVLDLADGTGRVGEAPIPEPSAALAFAAGAALVARRVRRIRS